MDIAQILEELAYDAGELPREAIESAVAKRELITPHLLKILSDSIQQIDVIIEQDNFQGHLYAMYLLAQFREERAYPLVLQLLSYPGDIPHSIAGDVLTEDLGRILACVSHGQIEPLQRAIENRSVNEYVRAASLAALVILVGSKQLSRTVVMDYFRTLFHHKLERHSSFVWGALVQGCCELHPAELLPEIAKAFEEGLVDRTFIQPSDVEEILQKSQGEQLISLYHRTELIEDTVTEMEKWITPLV